MSSIGWALSHDGESFDNDSWSTKEEAIAAAQEYLKLDDGERYYVGEVFSIDAKRIATISLFDKSTVEEAMNEEFGEWAEDCFGGLTQKDEVEINEAIAQMLFDRCPPSFFEVPDCEEVYHKKI